MLDRVPDKIDSLLDSLLSQYSAAQPRPGFEQRVLANLRQAQLTQPRFWTQPWFLGAATAFALTILIVVAFFSRPAQHSHPAPIQARQPVTHPERDGITLPPVRHDRAIARKAGPGPA